MKNKSFFILCWVLAAVWLTGCEKVVVDSGEPSAGTGANVSLRVSGFDMLPFDTRTGTPQLSDYCSRLSFVVYQGGKKVKTVHQKTDDEGFGSATMKLDAGDYQLLIVAHSSAGTPSLATPEKVQFTNADGFTDTFYYYGMLTVGSSAQTHDLTLKRAVSMFRLITLDGKPAAVKSVRFYYTGGSGALNALTGFGCVNSQQTVVFNLSDAAEGQPLRLEVYTFPHAQTGKLKIQVTACDALGSALYSREFADVPIEQNKVTQYSGQFFTDGQGNDPGGEGGDDAHSYVLTIDGAWDETLEYGF